MFRILKKFQIEIEPYCLLSKKIRIFPERVNFDPLGHMFRSHGILFQFRQQNHNRTKSSQHIFHNNKIPAVNNINDPFNTNHTNCRKSNLSDCIYIFLRFHQKKKK